MTQMHDLKQRIAEAKEAGDMDDVNALVLELKELVPEGKGMGAGCAKRGMNKGSCDGSGKGMGQKHEGCPFAK
jgi:hypothetical protein